jgi:hypothetical protein
MRVATRSVFVRQGGTMKAQSTVTVAVVGLGLLLSVLAFEGLSAVKRLPRPAPPAPRVATPWATSLAAVDEALARGDVRGALRAWQPAHGAALGHRRWDGLLEVGEARLRIERAAGVVRDGSVRDGKEQARLLYLMALFRARDAGSVDGVLRVATAFATLGDREVAERAVEIAAALETSR